ncbi:hypothetical protein BX661DRAFT_197061 [Kickxella alabastrina]|uniref:uncharacterized protein n=1 Tax=Kickxella alabastrina TaxID=61397 RepID=UPI00222110ED|nr:uncharacterized protein BX661DRAFT_197061 [Kickxella alabastrina]KAI7833201.1 hypothetical protein BX661DRAFT_197061 [Kickxella alabastrina]
MSTQARCTHEQDPGLLALHKADLDQKQEQGQLMHMEINMGIHITQMKEQFAGLTTRLADVATKHRVLAAKHQAKACCHVTELQARFNKVQAVLDECAYLMAMTEAVLSLSALHNGGSVTTTVEQLKFCTILLKATLSTCYQ